MIKDKNGQFEIMWLFIVFAIILILAFILSIGIAIAHWTSSVVTPIASDLGDVGGYNASAAGSTVFGALDTIIGMLPLLVGAAYLMILVGCVVLVLSYRGTQNPLFIGLFFALLIAMILVAILASNAYQDLYSGTDEIALELQSQTMLSFLILQSPLIFGVVGFICGIFLFSGRQNEQYGYGGGG